jgi:tetratricopeptide (TPR) repeat protein
MGFRPMAAIVIGNAGVLYLEHGDHDRALRCFAYALRIALELGDWTSVLTQLGNLGLTVADQHRTDVAERLLDRAVGLARALSAPYLLCEFLPSLARLRAVQGRVAEAERNNDEALETADRIDHRHHRLHGRLLSIRLAHTGGRIDGRVAEERLRPLLEQWLEPAEQAAIHAELWELTGCAPSRDTAVKLFRDLYERAPSQESREYLVRLTDEPLPPSPPLPPLAARITQGDVDVEVVLRLVDLIDIEQLVTA